MQKKFFSIACFFLCAASCIAQQYPFVYYTPKDGLVSSRIRNIRQDSWGRLYIITYGGLSVYDGSRFVNYHREDGLSNEVVNDVAEIAPDSLLVATNTDTLNTLVRGKIGVFKTADHYCPVVNKMLKARDGYWYMTSDNGLYRLEGNRFVKLPFKNADGKDLGSCLEQIVEWGNYFIVSPWNADLEVRMILYDRIQKKVVDIDSSKFFYQICTDNQHRVWICNQERIRVLDTLQLSRGKLAYSSLPSELRDIATQKSANIFFDMQGNTWVYTRDLIRLFSRQRNLSITAVQGLKTGTITNLFQDREGIIWMATDGNGIIKLKTTNVQMMDRMNPGKDLVASAITERADTTWLYNTADHSVYRFDGNKTACFVLPHIPFSAINLFADSEKLYLSDAKLIYCIADKNSKSSYKNPIPLLNSTGMILGNGILDNSGMLILHLNLRDTLFYLSAWQNGKEISRFQIPYTIDQLVLDHKGRLWIATRNDVLMVFKLDPGHPEHYFEKLKEYTTGLSNIGPRSMTVDRNNNLWIGTRFNGIFRLEMEDLKIKSIRQFTTREGLTDNFVFSLTCDHQNTIWAGTQTGLDKIFLKNNQYVISNISKSYNFFQSIRRVIATDKYVLALGSEGNILKIDQVPSQSRATSPPLLITSIMVNNQDLGLDEHVFSYKKNKFSFTVAAASFLDERGIKYSYRLKGSENAEWSEPSNNASFNFINLPPDHYVLEVRADFPEAIYPSQFTSYAFTINPPWWMTWWFLSIVFVSVLSLVLFFVRSYYHKRLAIQRTILEKKQAIEKERTRIATDMHDDLGAGLSRIKFLSETIGIKKQQHLPIEEEIGKIREYSADMIDKMGEIVWALNEKNDSLSDLLSYTRAYAVEYLAQEGLNCIVKTPDTFPSDFVSGEFRRNIFLSVKEILHNVIKHAQASQVQITMTTGGKLEVIIHDNGIGINHTRIRPYSNGLSNIKNRMKDIGGSMIVDNEVGTTITLQAPL